MRIALFHDLPPWGGAIRVLAEYIAVRAGEHELALYTRRLEHESLPELDSQVEVKRFPLRTPRTPIGRLAQLRALPEHGRALARAIDAAGHDVVFCHGSDRVQAPEILPFLETPSLYCAQEPLRSAYEQIPRLPGERASLGARLAARGLHPYERLRRAQDRRNIRAATLVSANSRYSAGRLREVYGVEAEVVLLGVDATAFAPGEDRRGRSVLSVGALHPLKGHQFVIEAVAAMDEPRPRLVVVGDRGAAGDSLQALAAARGVELELLHGVSSERMAELYRSAGAVACGQIREPFGLVTLEGMAACAPVVAVAEGGFSETVRDGETGLLVERDAHSFARALERVLDDPQLAAGLGRAGRAAVLASWRWERTMRGYDALLERIARR